MRRRLVRRVAANKEVVLAAVAAARARHPENLTRTLTRLSSKKIKNHKWHIISNMSHSSHKLSLRNRDEFRSILIERSHPMRSSPMSPSIANQTSAPKQQQQQQRAPHFMSRPRYGSQKHQASGSSPQNGPSTDASNCSMPIRSVGRRYAKYFNSPRIHMRMTQGGYCLMMDSRLAALLSSIVLVILLAGAATAAPSQPALETNLTAASLSPSSSSPPSTPPLAPRSERQPILEMFNKFFTKARSHDDQQQKEFVREGVIHRMRDLGFESSFLQKSRFEFRQDKHKRIPAVSYNIISILPGKHRRTKDEQIVLVGAHWDSAPKAPGVDDNGSGSTCLLEIARLISEHNCKFNHTIMLVWFDYEEQGKYGSEFFVNDYLYPYELDKYQSKFIGAYIMDMILVRDKENNTQALPENLRKKLPQFFDELESEKSRGDFLATWSRKHWDEPLENVFRNAWQDLGYEARTFKAMRPELPQMRMPNDAERFEWKDFFRSDHASFWFPPLTSGPVRRAPNRTSAANHTSLNAILLTDLGPWRQSYLKCYHSSCDDEHLLTDGNLSFMQQVVDTLVLALMRTGQGECGQTTPITSLTEGTESQSSLASPMMSMMMMKTATKTSMTTTKTDPEVEADVVAAATIAKVSVPSTNNTS